MRILEEIFPVSLGCHMIRKYNQCHLFFFLFPCHLKSWYQKPKREQLTIQGMKQIGSETHLTLICDPCLSFQERGNKKSFPIIQGNIATLTHRTTTRDYSIDLCNGMANGGKFAPCSRKFGARFQAENGPKLTSSQFSLSQSQKTRELEKQLSSFLRSFVRSCGV